MTELVLKTQTKAKRMFELTCKSSDLKTDDVIELLVRNGLLSKKEAESMVRRPPIDLKRYLFSERQNYLPEQGSFDFVFMNKAPSIPNVRMINEF